jgi:hypothetical protein
LRSSRNHPVSRTDFWEMGLRMGERVDEQHEPFITPSVGRC